MPTLHRPGSCDALRGAAVRNPNGLVEGQRVHLQLEFPIFVREPGIPLPEGSAFMGPFSQEGSGCAKSPPAALGCQGKIEVCGKRRFEECYASVSTRCTRGRCGLAAESCASYSTLLPKLRPSTPEAGRTPKLTKREEGLVHLVAEGLTNCDISRQLNLSENTVRNYLFRIFNKLGTSNRLELALSAITQREGESSGRG